MLILRLKSTDPYWNLAAEEYLLLNREGDDILLIWQNANTIVVGLHQNILAEINPAFVDERKIRLVRRRSGGGAVYHDLGNLNFSFITSLSGARQNTMQRFTLPVLRALCSLGLAAEACGRNDILINGCKVSGNAQSLHQQRILHHGTLLFAADLHILGQALQARPEKFLSKGIKSLRARVGNIKDFLPPEMAANFGINDLAACLIREFAGQGSQKLSLSENDLAAISRLRDEKYLSHAWNYGQAPACSFRNGRKYAGGWLEVLLDIKQGKIAACQFQGDFLALRPATEVADRLLGLAYSQPEIAALLDALPLSDYFGSITRAEILDCLFTL